MQIDDIDDALRFVADCDEEVISEMEDGVIKDTVSEVRRIIDDMRGGNNDGKA